MIGNPDYCHFLSLSAMTGRFFHNHAALYGDMRLSCSMKTIWKLAFAAVTIFPGTAIPEDATPRNRRAEASILLKQAIAKAAARNYKHAAMDLKQAVELGRWALYGPQFPRLDDPMCEVSKCDPPLIVALNIENKLWNRAAAIQVAAELLADGASPNARSAHDLTALMLAVKQRQPDIVRFLLESKADPNAETSLGIESPRCHTALDWAVGDNKSAESLQIIATLEQYSAVEGVRPALA